MAEPLIYHRIEYKPADPSKKFQNSIGGFPYLPQATDWPKCSCKNRMNLYLQFNIRKEFGLPFEAGSHLVVFMCEACNGLTDRLFYFFRNKSGRFQDRLRANYWTFNGAKWGGKWSRFYRLMLFKPEGKFKFLSAEGFIQPCSLEFKKSKESWTPDHNAPGWVPDEKEIDFRAEPGLPGTSANLSVQQYSARKFKVGGQPAWGADGNRPSDLLCSCGAPMGFVCFVPDELVFPNDRTTVYTYEHVGTLFTGLCVYILACRAQCHPFAVYPVTQP